MARGPADGRVELVCQKSEGKIEMVGFTCARGAAARSLRPGIAPANTSDRGRLGSTGARRLRRTSTRTAKPEQRQETDGMYMDKPTFKGYQFMILSTVTAPPLGPQVVRLPRGQGHRRHRGRQQQERHRAHPRRRLRRRSTTGQPQNAELQRHQRGLLLQRSAWATIGPLASTTL